MITMLNETIPYLDASTIIEHITLISILLSIVASVLSVSSFILVWIINPRKKKKEEISSILTILNIGYKISTSGNMPKLKSIKNILKLKIISSYSLGISERMVIIIEELDEVANDSESYKFYYALILDEIQKSNGFRKFIEKNDLTRRENERK